jgi:uncharacterized oxidoreductase
VPVIAADQLHATLVTIYIREGVPPKEAQVVADHQVRANLAGHDAHGAIRTSDYVAQLRNGEVQAGAPTAIVSETATTAVVDGNWNFGFIATNRGLDVALDKARTAGVAAITIRRQGHVGRLSDYASRAAENGFIAMVTADSGNGPKAVAPYGGRARRLGTNPLAIAVPSDIGPVVTDMATTTVAAGKLRLARIEGRPIPRGWIVDRDGLPSTNPDDYFNGGALLPLGGDQGHKGYGLSFMVEVLSGLLTGIGFAENPDGIHNDGVFLMAVAVDRFRPLAQFTADVAAFVDYVKSSPLAAGFSEILYPGELERRTDALRRKEGVPIDDATWTTLRELSGLP